ncbi:hypothetical protein BUALT_Bualt06G0099900 [Buddleja alternifolia]|uniref:Uncharacterized protein n=1 Tax=Buddleja alternifolia TaxID=168488 RepID=A0AAV6XFN9_9LAMI|nr:hypothetical protein BUALT_Bualt06G0099900 [Buddleja alternifolia]
MAFLKFLGIYSSDDIVDDSRRGLLLSLWILTFLEMHVLKPVCVDVAMDVTFNGTTSHVTPLNQEPRVCIHERKIGLGVIYSKSLIQAIICGKVGQAPIQKILKNGKIVATFTVGTGGMFDQRLVGQIDLPKRAQWHHIAVHNPMLGAYAVQQLVKNSSVYVEGDIETRVYNDSINGEIKSIPEICVRRDDWKMMPVLEVMSLNTPLDSVSYAPVKMGQELRMGFKLWTIPPDELKDVLVEDTWGLNLFSLLF